MTPLKHFLKQVALMIGLVAFLSGCSSLKTAYDYDSSANFGAYQTYAFTEESAALGADPLNNERILKAVEQELSARGLRKASEPDVLVDVHLKTQQRVEAVANTTGGGYRYGYYGGMGMSTTTVNYNEYTDGSLFITLVDAASQKVVWQGAGTKTLSEGLSPEKREQNIQYAVQKILYNYPPKSK